MASGRPQEISLSSAKVNARMPRGAIARHRMTRSELRIAHLGLRLVEQESGDGAIRHPRRRRQGVSGLDDPPRIQGGRHQRDDVGCHTKTPFWRREARAGIQGRVQGGRRRRHRWRDRPGSGRGGRCTGGDGHSDSHPRHRPHRRGPDRGGYRRRRRRRRDRNARGSTDWRRYSGGSRCRVPSAASKKAASSWVRAQRTKRTRPSSSASSPVTARGTYSVRRFTTENRAASRWCRFSTFQHCDADVVIRR